MKSKIHSLLCALACGAALFAFGVPAANADLIWKGDTNTDFNTGSNYVGGSYSQWANYVFDSNAVNGTMKVDDYTGWGNIFLNSGLTTDIVITSDNPSAYPIIMAPAKSEWVQLVPTLGGTITIASDSKDLTIGTTVFLAGELVMNIGANRTLTINGQFSDWNGATATLKKQGAGTAILTGNNFYTGRTTVTSGTLRLGNGTTPANLADSADVLVATGAMLDLDYTGTDQISGLWVDGSQLPPGVYSSTSGFITGIGTLTVSTGPACANYAGWSGRGGYNLINGPSGDDDHDGIPNLLEYIFGGNPLAASHGILPTSGVAGDKFVFTFHRNQTSIVEAPLVFQYSTDLTGWTDVPVDEGTVGNVTVAIAPQSGFDTVTITLPASTNPKIFGRLKVSIPDFDLLLKPFWESTTMYEEPLFFAERVVGQPPTATLLFPPENILEVKSANGKFTYQEGKDFTINKVTGVVSLLPGTTIPSKNYQEIYPYANSALPNKISHKRGDENTFLIFSEGRFFHDLQVSVTYTHGQNAWNGIIPRHAGSDLPGVLAKLQAKAPVTICLSGDSISYGANASGMIKAPPFLPCYGELVAIGLERKFGSKINLRNFAVGGWQSQNGVADVGKVAAEKPDLVIIGYGMNDSSSVTTETYIANIRAIMSKVSETSPDAEFILVASMLPNAEWHAPNMERFATYRDALAATCGKGVVMADMTSVWEELLQRKSFLDITGNGVNHPNDFGHRLYGQTILQLISTEN